MSISCQQQPVPVTPVKYSQATPKKTTKKIVSGPAMSPRYAWMMAKSKSFNKSLDKTGQEKRNSLPVDPKSKGNRKNLDQTLKYF